MPPREPQARHIVGCVNRTACGSVWSSCYGGMAEKKKGTLIVVAQLYEVVYVLIFSRMLIVVFITV